MKKAKTSEFGYHHDHYYEGPTENQYIGWTEEEIEEDIRKAEEKCKKYKEWSEVDC